MQKVVERQELVQMFMDLGRTSFAQLRDSLGETHRNRRTTRDTKDEQTVGKIERLVESLLEHDDQLLPPLAPQSSVITPRAKPRGRSRPRQNSQHMALSFCR